MKPTNAALLNILVALIFAVAILFADSLLAGSEHSDTVKYLLIALWWIPFSFLSTCTKCAATRC